MEPNDDHPQRRKQSEKQSHGVPVWVWAMAGGFALLILVGGGAALLLWAPWKNSDSDEALKRDAQDLQAYANKLKNTVPLGPGAAYNAMGLKAESYEMDDELGMFKVLVLKIEPVYLTDKITGLTRKYTRARLVRNNPPPMRRDPQGGILSFPEEFAWLRVNMLE